MKNKKSFVLFVVFLSIFGITLYSVVQAELIFGEISVSPSSPLAQSTITISIPISGDTPSEVRVRVEECNERTGICFSDIHNVSMSLVNAGIYQTSLTLIHAEATYINCTVMVNINGTWTSSAKWKIVNLSEITNGNTNENGDENKNKTPGFEVVFIIFAIGISLIMLGRKRAK